MPHDSAAPRVAIIDYGMGNLYSVKRACEHEGLRTIVTDDPSEVLAADGVVLPGVGSMPDAMASLRQHGLDRAIETAVSKETPFFGVCLGLQLLMTEGTEFERHAGLGIIPGEVVRFEGTDPVGGALRVPHIGWSAVRRPDAVAGDAWQDTPLAGQLDDVRMYFVHSYYVVPWSTSDVVAVSAYGSVAYCSAVSRGNVFACQFHPERSGTDGLAIYRRFAERLGARSNASSTS